MTDKRVAWVTGGATGIGLATCEMLAERGWRVAISSRRAANVDEAVAKTAAKAKDKADVIGLPSTSRTRRAWRRPRRRSRRNGGA